MLNVDIYRGCSDTGQSIIEGHLRSNTFPIRFRRGSDLVPIRFRSRSDLVPLQLWSRSETDPARLPHASFRTESRPSNPAPLLPPHVIIFASLSLPYKNPGPNINIECPVRKCPCGYTCPQKKWIMNWKQYEASVGAPALTPLPWPRKANHFCGRPLDTSPRTTSVPMKSASGGARPQKTCWA